VIVLIGAGILASVLASIAAVWLLAWVLAKNLPAFLALTAGFVVAISWIIGAGALQKPMPPAGIVWFAFGSAFLLIWAIIEPPGGTGPSWKTNGSTKAPDRDRTHDAA